MASSISAPVYPTDAEESLWKWKSFPLNLPANLRLRWIFQISFRASSPGKSTKNSSSNLPFRNMSCGRRSISLAVATMNTGSFFSSIHSTIEPQARALIPDSCLSMDASPVNPFSTPSIHKMLGAIARAMLWAFLMFR